MSGDEATELLNLAPSTAAMDPLLLGSLHLPTQIGSIAAKQLVAVSSTVWSLGNPSKAIQVELPLERCQLEA